MTEQNSGLRPPSDGVSCIHAGWSSVIPLWMLFLSLVTSAKAAPPSAAWPKASYDEFTTTSIDTAKWSYGSLPWGGQHHTADYASWITSADSYQTNGSLVLRCRRAVGSEFGGIPYSEGFVHSNGKMNYTYGYVEIRGRYPLGKGVWPAFWSLPSGWPPEFDIAEYFGSDGRMHMGLVTGTSGSPVWNNSNFYQSSGEAFQNWHTYGLEWGPGYAIWYKDGNVKKSIYASSVPSAPMYVILNSGMRYDADGTTPIPNYFEVDSFRKYDPPSAAVNDNTTGTGVNQFNYVGTWSYGSQSGAFFGDNHWSGVANTYVQIQFTGTRVDLYGGKASSHGIAAVSIDGGAEALVDYYATSRTDKILLWSASGLPYGAHTLKVRVTGTRNASSSGNTITTDRVDVWGTPTRLAGAIIGTSGSWNNGGDTLEKATDGNLNTFFDGPVADGNWLGLDLGVTPKRVTKILYCPRSTYAGRMTGGIFQGANVSDFSDAVNLFTISADPVEQTMTEQIVSNTNGFRYVRYLAPAGGNGNVAEVEFYGTEVGAANGTWSTDADGDWGNAGKWNGGNVAGGAGFTADFSTLNITASRTVTLDLSRNIGTLRFGDTSGSQNWTITSSDGSALTLDTGSATQPAIVVANTATLAASLAGANGFVKSGAGTLILDASNSLSGALNLDRGINGNNNDGATRIAHPDAVANVASLNIRNTSVSTAGGATLQLDGTAGNIAIAQNISVTCRNNSTTPTIQNLAGTNTLAGIIALGGGGNMFNLQSDAGLLILSGTNQYVGSLTGPRTYAFSGAGNHLVSGPIINSTNGAPISLTKSGTGTLTLAGNNTYGDTTTVSGGTLLVNGSVGTGVITVASSASLRGSGTIRGPVTIQSGAILSPGTSVGTLVFSNNLTLATGSTTSIEINKELLTHDQVRVSGTLTAGGTLVVTNLAGVFAPDDSFQLFVAGTFADGFAAIVPATPGPGLLWDTTGLVNGVLGVIAAPMPRFTSIVFSAAGVLVTGTNGMPNGTYHVLNSTNLTLPLTNWTRVLTSTFNADGVFIFSNAVTASVPHEFFLIQLP